MEYLFWIVVSYLYYRVFQQLIGIFQTWNIFFQPEKKGKHRKPITILIPIYCEDKILRETIEFWKKSPIKPIFVLTKRERLAGCRGKMILEMLSDFEIIVSPNTIGYKAIQLNYALSKIDLEGYIAIFDVDSRPDFGVFEYVAYLSGDIYQMPIRYIPNSSIFSLGSAIYQTRFSLAYEIPAILNGNFTYLVGHGLFVKGEIFYNILFHEETLTEDIVFGYETYLNGYHPKPLPFFEYSSVPDTFWKSIQQGTRWFIGSWTFIKYIDTSKLGLREYIAIFLRYLQLLDWFWGLFWIVAIFLFAPFYLKIATVIALMVFGYIYYITIRLGEYPLSFATIFGIAFKTFTNFLVPLYSLFQIVLLKHRIYWFYK